MINAHNDAKKSLENIRPGHYWEGHRVVAILKPLTEYKLLRERILKPDVLKALVNLLDSIIDQKKGNFGQAMDGMTCLLQCGALVIVVHLETG